MRHERYLDSDGVEQERIIFDTLDAADEMRIALGLGESEAMARARRAADALRRIPLYALTSAGNDSRVPSAGEPAESPVPCGRAVKIILGRSGRSAGEIAREIGKTTNYLDAITGGSRTPMVATLVGVAGACGYRLALVPNGVVAPDGTIVLR